MPTGHGNEHIRYEADERCPRAVAVAVGLQGVLVILAPVVVNVAVVFRCGGQSEAYLSWAVVAALPTAPFPSAVNQSSDAPTKPARARRRNDPATRTGPRSPESLTLDSLRVSESPNAHRTRPVARGPDRDRPCDIVSATVPPTTQEIGAPQLHRRCDSRFGPVPGRHSAAHRCMFLPETCEARRSSGL